MVNRALKLLKKIRRCSPDELRLRVSQALSAYGERAGYAARLPSDTALFRLLDDSRICGRTLSADSLLANFRERIRPRFFVAFEHPQRTVQALRQLFGPQAEERVAERARRMKAGRFDLLGLRDLDFGEPLDWHR